MGGAKTKEVEIWESTGKVVNASWIVIRIVEVSEIAPDRILILS